MKKMRVTLRTADEYRYDVNDPNFNHDRIITNIEAIQQILTGALATAQSLGHQGIISNVEKAINSFTPIAERPELVFEQGPSIKGLLEIALHAVFATERDRRALSDRAQNELDDLTLARDWLASLMRDVGMIS